MPVAPASPYTRQNPFPGKLVVNRTLCSEGSKKDTRHFEIDLTGWGLNYEVGDSMTVWPTNDPALADEIIRTIGARGEEQVNGPKRPDDPARNVAARLPHHADDAQVLENDRCARQRGAVTK
jgi:sulfite reductase (NADPH) flavoprotein alpha-component